MKWLILLLAYLAYTNAFTLTGVPAALSDDDYVLSALSADIANKYADEYISYLRTGVESDDLKKLTAQLAASHSKKDLLTKSTNELSAGDQFFLCTTCRATMNVLAREFRENLNGTNGMEEAKRIVIQFCDRFNIQTAEVCEGMVELNWPYVNYIIWNTLADSRTFCAMLPIGICQVEQEEFNFRLKVDSSKPTLTSHKSTVPKKTNNDWKILQLTDIHYDPNYVPGSLADCDAALCCQSNSGQGVISAEKQAGYWSDYRYCDSPIHLINDAFDHITATHKDIKYIYQTGDIVPHLVWATSKESNKLQLTEINNLIKEKFADIPVYSCIGNHEAHPMNVFGTGDIPEELKINWLYEHLYDLWSKWLPAETKETILKGGYYTVTPEKGFRIISLNNNDCYLFNWWLFYNGSIAIDQLNWLHDTLLAAEKAGEYVHILAHLPSGDSDCWTVWAREYNRIIERFNGIIGGIFTGHTHVDEMNINYSPKGYAMGITWNGGSLTTYTDKNPNYRMYEVEPTTYQVVEQESWIFNLTQANELGSSTKPQWFKEFEFTTEFTTDLSPAGLDTWLEKMAAEPSLLRKYWSYKMTMADPKLKAGCNNQCLLYTICRLATTVFDQKDRCTALRAKLEQSLANENPETTTDKPTSTSQPPKEDEEDGAAVLTGMSALSIITLSLILRQL